MKFFIDTANLQEIKQANELGVLDGVTTNPSLIAKEGVDFVERIEEICKVVNGPISAEVVSVSPDGMVKEGRKLSKIHPNVVVKCPLTLEGLKATKILSGEGIKVNVTLCFSPAQALFAAKAGASFISPFIGRLDDISHVGMDLVADIRHIYDNYGFKTQILAASIRHPLHVIEAAKLGADIATMPFSVLMSLLKHPLTDIGLSRFLKDWEKVPQRQWV